MTGIGSYSSATAFRQALEDRLKTEALETGVPYDRLRKEAAFQRLLARLERVAPQDSWALKGGLALIARIGTHVRATRDVDTNWRQVQAELEKTLDAVIDTDLDDGFEFEIGDPRPLEGEGPEGALRYTVTARLAGKVFEQLKLDINLTTQDPRPVEIVEVKRNPFAFIGEGALRLPMISPSQQLAEKLHAYTRQYAKGTSSRPRDLFDMLVIAQEVELPNCGEVATACRQTFEMRQTPWPPEFNPPPEDWESPWLGFITDYPLPWRTAAQGYEALANFWAPILENRLDQSFNWDAETWAWKQPPQDSG